ncbi:hypothetical protein I302_103853 [Kwoniella bestiolae CBS 10118]|uniref:Uncharacterized protein n=1 Tax=Kwoniella bestiolae CBS 10118 TaxID=1296100 RepID=A0A1B9G9N4_9TREE|nr:hypothetical protein I302_02556 [Kwoniella bestiolae CBS 10118]OCF27711.1 hypothetical protein I302_02556 [Kwoniella bestiolae CBS 10118]
MPKITPNAISLLEADQELGEYQYDEVEPSLAADGMDLDEDDEGIYQLEPNDEDDLQVDRSGFFGPTTLEARITEEDTMLVTNEMIREGKLAHPALGKILRLEVMDRNLMEDDLRAWLNRTYSACSDEAKSIAQLSIARLRELIEEGCSSIYSEAGLLRKRIPGTTSFADCLLEDYTFPDSNVSIQGDQVLLAIGLDRNSKLGECFKRLYTSPEASPILDAHAVRSASKVLGSQTYSGVYTLDFGGKKLYIGVSDDMIFRSKTHEENEINIMVAKEKRKLHDQGKPLLMRVVLGWPRGKCPKLGSLAWETYMICALQTYKGKNQMQVYAIAGLLGPGIAIKHFRPAYLRYVQAARAAAETHDLPPTRCFKIMNPYPDELDASLKFYTALFDDLIKDSGLDPMRFIQIVVGTYQGERNRMLTREMQKEGYIPPRLAHPQARGFEFGKKYNWEPGMKGMDRRALALNKEHGVAKPARTLRATTLPPLPQDYLDAMISRYTAKAELLKQIYPPPENDADDEDKEK